MEHFTYHRKGARLRLKVNTLLTLLSAEMLAYLIIGPFLPFPADWALVGFTIPTAVFVYWFIPREYRIGGHQVTPDALLFRTLRTSLSIPRTLITGVTPYRQPLPKIEIGPEYLPRLDAIVHLPDTKRVVEIRLKEAITVTLQKGKPEVSFTRLLLSVDEPERLIAALAGAQEEPLKSAEIKSSEPSHINPALSKSIHEPTGSPILHLEGLEKRFGQFQAVHPLHLTVHPGEILAFLGSNGAGKTTTLRMVTGLLRPSGGTVRIAGVDAWADPRAARRHLGYVPDTPLLWEGLTAREYLWLVAGLHAIPEAEAKRRAAELLERLGLTRWADGLIRHFSLGMKRKMAIAAALIHQPDLLLLDEVTNGLDPRASRDVKDWILAAAREGKGVLLTTHILDLAAELADRIAILDGGRLCAIGTLEELRVQAGLPDGSLEDLFLALTGGRPEVSA